MEQLDYNNETAVSYVVRAKKLYARRGSELNHLRASSVRESVNRELEREAEE
jgi:hypothetical protein